MRVLIVGAGLGGLTAALALSRCGLDVAVYEQATVLREVGAGLTVSRGAQRVLAELGLGTQLLARASTVRSNAFVHYRTGALLDGAVDHTDGSGPADGVARNVQMHRADLHDLLVTTLRMRAPGALQLGRRFVDVSEYDARVTVTFADGSVVDGDLLLGADGLRSQVRACLWGAEDPRFTGQVAFRALVPGTAAAPFLASDGRAAVYLGPDRVFNRYALRRGAVVNCVAIARTDSWREEGWTIPATHAELAALYAGWHPNVLGLIGAAPSLSKWALYDRDPLPRWGTDRVSLLGDAAHPMLPFLGLGSAMAIEDGLVLGRALAAAPGPEGLARYEAARRPRTTEVMLQSRREGGLVQADDPHEFEPDAAPSRKPIYYDFDPALIQV